MTKPNPFIVVHFNASDRCDIFRAAGEQHTSVEMFLRNLVLEWLEDNRLRTGTATITPIAKERSKRTHPSAHAHSASDNQSALDL